MFRTPIRLLPILVAVLLASIAWAEGEKKSKPAPKKPAGMVLIPAGTFVMGVDAADPKKPGNDSPRHEVKLPAFYIDRYEVTNREFEAFVKARGYDRKEFWSKEGLVWRGTIKRKAPEEWENRKKALGKEFGNHPVVGISWYEAEAFAKYSKKRLLTEAEWARAARGTKGRTFPWGEKLETGLREKPEDEAGRTYPVGSHGVDVTPEGVYDLGGNVAEWTSSWFEPYPKTKAKSRYWGKDAKKKLKVARGASWRFMYMGPRPSEPKCRSSYRLFQYPHTDGYAFIGLRLAKDVPPKK